MSKSFTDEENNVIHFDKTDDDDNVIHLGKTDDED